jgi:tetratricopeptide (TPR) repeat protein
MRKYVVWPAAALLVGGVVASAPAQQKEGEGQQASECDLKTSHFAVNRAVLYIQNALSSQQDSAKKRQSLEGAQRSLQEALDQGQASNPAVWHYLGIYHTMMLDEHIGQLAKADSAADSTRADSLQGTVVSDVVAADTSFDKVEAAVPGCQKEDEQFRYMAWARIANLGIAAMRESNYDKAKALFATADKVYTKDPTTYFYTATLFATDNNADSALYYFKQAAQIADGDTAFTEIHEKSVQNVARIYQVVEKWDSAATWFKDYRAVRPDDFDALIDLGTVYFSAADAARDAGDSSQAKADVEKAMALHDSIMAQADPLDATLLFRWGVAEFRADRPMAAAQAFEAGLKKNPYYRNGLFNLTNAYFQEAQELQSKQKLDSAKVYAGKMLPAAKRLAAVDPLNRPVLRLVAAAFQFLGQDDSTDALLKKVNAMSYEMEVQSARATSGGYEVQGTITALRPPAAQAVMDSIAKDSTTLATLKQTTVPAAQQPQLRRREASVSSRLKRLHASLEKAMGPVSVPTITFDFLDKDGNVITTQTVAAQAIEPSGTRQFDLTATGDNIVAWRYKAGS